MKNILISIIAIMVIALIGLCFYDIAYIEELWQTTSDLSPQRDPHYIRPELRIKPLKTVKATSTVFVTPIKGQNLGLHEVSAYNPVSGQTDGSPCVGAKNINVCAKLEAGEAVCAANFVKIGTKLQIGELLSCTVYDRINPKYKNRVDVMFPANMVDEAKSFGIKKELIYIIK